MQLVPFNYLGFQTGEAIWNDNTDQLRRLRFTRKGWGELFGAKNPQTYLDILKHRHPELPEGIPFTVKGMTGQEYITFTLDIYDGFQYAAHSDLPRARGFVKGFPDFLTAVLKGQVVPPPADLATLAYMDKWTHGKGKEIKRIAQDENVTESTIRRHIERVKKGEPINKNLKGFKKPYVQIKYRSIYKEAIRLRKEEKWTGIEISKKLGIPEKTVYRWFNRDFN